MNKGLREIIAALNRDGFKVEVGRANKHYALRVERDGKRGRIFVSKTPSDYRFYKNIVTDARRAVK